MGPVCDPSRILKPAFVLHVPSFSFKNLKFKSPKPPRLIKASSASTSEIDMVKNSQGTYTSKHSKVVLLWDLDNKPLRGPLYPAAIALKHLAQTFGEIIEMSAYANHHAFIHLPNWVLQEPRQRKQLDVFERKGVVLPSEPYVCGVCGRKCRTNLDLKKHFKQLHERERQKKVNRLNSLKGKKRRKYKERFISGNHKYNEEARRLVTPKTGYGLAGELRRAGVYVKTVEDKPQAADWALKRQIEHSMTRGVDWLFLISDDSDFADILRRAREANLGTVVVGDRDRALGRHADYWVSWVSVENGEVSENDLVPKDRRESEGFGASDGFFSVTGFDDDSDDMDNVLNQLVGSTSRWNGESISAFSEGEEEEEEDGDYLLWDSEDEGEEGDFFI
ncbi:C2H2-like zinc finger protein [Euphorbia peplus]|nr:C2H2-like zinc finger protein [Euphorbia peplus]